MPRAESEIGGDSRGGWPAAVENFIKTNMPLAPAPSLPEILIHKTHPASGLGRFSKHDPTDAAPRPPYWAYPWAGGAALARYFLDRPETVCGRQVLDFGAGSGVVGIAAAKGGASKVIAAEIDGAAITALRLNAAANGVAIEAIAQDLIGGDPPAVDLIAVGDLFYERELAERVTSFLDRCLAVGVEILVGDVGRAYLPRARLRLIAEYPVRDFGDGESAALKSAGIFAYSPRLAKRGKGGGEAAG